jgi:hypothetical protein
MTPTQFDFIVKMPGDARLVEAIRQLALQAGGYARLPDPATEQLAVHVERAAEAAISASTNTSVLEFRFVADAEALVVVFSCELPASGRHPASTSNGEVTVDWTVEGSRQVCRIRRRISA